MATDPDPYRTLGLTRGASLDEVKRAYRRLAKSNHPDAAGEAALPRFLAIQAAYDQITGYGSAAPAMRRGRRRASPGTLTRRGPTRRDAPTAADRDGPGPGSRERAGRARPGQRARRDRPARPAGPGVARSTGTGGTGSPGGASGRPRRPPNKATLGSTSYDGAEDQPFEPDWGGASWYGTTSGTYWTLNPKEYADPRKHGPEYQARARRAAASRGAAAGGATMGGPTTSGPDVVAPDLDPAATHTEATGTTADAGATADAGPAARSTPRRTDPAHPHDVVMVGRHRRGVDGAGSRDRAAHRSGAARDVVRRPTRHARSDRRRRTATRRSAAGLVATWLDPAASGLPIRVGRAVVGWAPIALGIGWLVGELSGCSRFAATCDPAASPIAWVAQLAVLVALVIVPRLAVMAFLATLAVLAAAVPAALILTATGRSSIGGEAQAGPDRRTAVLGGICSSSPGWPGSGRASSASCAGRASWTRATRHGPAPPAVPYPEGHAPSTRPARPVRRGPGIPPRPSGRERVGGRHQGHRGQRRPSPRGDDPGRQ